MQQRVAVIDLGKTHKKVAVYGRDLRPHASRTTSLPAVDGPDGVRVEPTAAIWAWLRRELSDLYREAPFAAIAISTHGATIACLDASGALALPVVAYDQHLDEAAQNAIDRAFYALVGDSTRLQAETGTCDLPLLINPAKALLWYRQRYPAGLARTARIVHYPQYWGHLLTGVVGAEPTYTFNHSYLHALAGRGPSSAARALGVDHLLDRRFRRPWDRLGVLTPRLQAELGLPALPVAVGIHDSNAALLPYLLLHAQRDFVLNSTGTWCVAMHRVAAPVYAPEELGSKVIFNIDALGGWQKVSFLMGGQDYALYHELIGGGHVGLDVVRLEAALAEPGRAVLPGAFPSQFPTCRGGVQDGARAYTVAELRAGSRPGWLADPALAHDLLNASLALQSAVALRRTGIADTTAIFVEGGFRDNPTYLAVLAALFPRSRVACTSLEQATAVGTALLGYALLDGGDPRAEGLAIGERVVPVPSLGTLPAYAAAWTALAEGWQTVPG